MEGPITQTHMRAVQPHQLQELNELQQVEFDYQNALRAMVSKPTQQNRDNFYKWNKRFTEVRDAYRVGARLIAEYVLSKLV